MKTVNHLLKADTRIPPDTKKQLPFWSKLICERCGQNMVRKTISTKQKSIYIMQINEIETRYAAAV